MAMTKKQDLYKIFFVFVSYWSIMIYIVLGQLYLNTYCIMAYPYRPLQPWWVERWAVDYI